MLTIDPQSNTERENYKILTGSIIPRPIAFVTSISEEGILNGAPFSYFNIAATDPPMISLSLKRVEGKLKDTARNLLDQQEFVVHLVGEQNVEDINQTAASLPPEESEVDLAGLTTVESDKVAVPGIKQAKVRMECVLEHHVLLGDSEMSGNDFFIGRIIQFHIDTTIYEEGKINPRELAAVSRLAGADYAKVGDTFALQRPK